MKLFLDEVDFQFIQDSFAVSLTTVVVMVLLEAMTWDEKWRQQWKEEKIRKLYFQAILSNAFHFFVIGPAAYGLASAFISWMGKCNPSYVSIPGSLLVQGFGYTLVHSWMHIPSNYWIHKYHHGYNEHSFVRPITANAVAVLEFILAYMLTNVVAVVVFRPGASDMYYIVMSVSMANLLIHTSPETIPMGFLPTFLCSNIKHSYHHEDNVRAYYSAPIFDFDQFTFAKKYFKYIQHGKWE
mmetsp:Transcript_13823/g.20374  ORF Transcript_13823/g.20374 Transcript_13823/m.20374 type:complete len:240 (-) Transcript_13823:17-736(-)